MCLVIVKFLHSINCMILAEMHIFYYHLSVCSWFYQYAFQNTSIYKKKIYIIYILMFVSILPIHFFKYTYGSP